MKICVLALGLKPGGGQRLVLEECKYLLSRGHELVLIVPEDDYSFRAGIHAENLEIMIYPKSEFRYLPLIWRFAELFTLRNIIKNQQINLLISHYNDIDAYVTTVATNINYICHINGSRFWFSNLAKIYAHRSKEGFNDLIDSVEGHGTFYNKRRFFVFKIIFHKIREAIRTKALKNAALVTTITRQVANELSFCYGVTAHVSYPGVDPGLFEPKSKPDYSAESSTKKYKIILSVGRLDKRKRTDLLIRSFAKMLETRNDVKLIIVGTGNEEAALKSLARDLKISQQVIFVGRVEEKKLWSLYEYADLFAHPAWTAYGLAPLEAYALGTPVAISTDTGAREILGDHPGVSLIHPDVQTWSNKLSEILNNSSKDFDNTIVPTWTEYFENKYAILQ